MLWGSFAGGIWHLKVFHLLLKATSWFTSSGQDGGVGRNPWLPHTTKKRITTNLKTTNNQKCQKIKMHGTPTTKELKKQSTRPTKPVGGRQTTQRTKRMQDKAAEHVGRAGWKDPRQGSWPECMARQGLAERTWVRAERYSGEAANHAGRAGWTGNWDWELTVDYDRGCHCRRNSQSHTKVCWKVGLGLHCSLSGPSPTSSTPQHSKEGCPAWMHT